MRADATGGPRPTVMILGGGDTTCEELYDFGGGAAAVRRGYNAFLWEGPGQVGAYALDPESDLSPGLGGPDPLRRRLRLCPATTSTPRGSRSRGTAWADTSPRALWHTRSASPR